VSDKESLARKKPKPLEIRILQKIGEDGKLTGDFIQVPKIWIDELMDSKTYRNVTRNGKRTGIKHNPRIPNSFWKYTLIMWRGFLDGNIKREATIARCQFYLRTGAVTRWTAAYTVSGLFDIYPGQFPDISTHFEYHRDATPEEWKAFIVALDWTLADFKDSVRKSRVSARSNTPTFQWMLAVKVDSVRKEMGLPVVNDTWIKHPPLDRRERPVVQDGQPLFYQPEKRVYVEPMQPGHPKGCLCDTCNSLREQMDIELEEAS